MQIRKTYFRVNPELLFNEIKDFTTKQGAAVSSSQMETYSMPNDSASFTSRGTLTFRMVGSDRDCLSAHIVGSAKGETKLLIEVDESLFRPEKFAAVQSDLDFMLGSFEMKPGEEPEEF